MGAAEGLVHKRRRCISPYTSPVAPIPFLALPALKAPSDPVLPGSLTPDVFELWTGRRAPVAHPNALNGVVNGHVPFRAKRGRCRILCTGPSLWFFVAEALGFEVAQASSPCVSFGAAMMAFFPQVSFRSGRVRGNPVNLVLADFGMLPPLGCVEYWSTELVPHLVALGQTETSVQCLTAPDGWVIHRRDLVHSDFGGSTDGSHSLALLCPGSCAMGSEVKHSLPRQPWIPLLAAINSVSNAPPCAAPPAGDFSLPHVYMEGDVVLPFGLSPLHVWVLACACHAYLIGPRAGAHALSPLRNWLRWLTCLSSCRSGCGRPVWRTYCWVFWPPRRASLFC